jgi:hypothetical protein
MSSSPGMTNTPSRSMCLEVEHLIFYTRSMAEMDSEAAKSERHSSPDKSRGETEKKVLSGRAIGGTCATIA